MNEYILFGLIAGPWIVIVFVAILGGYIFWGKMMKPRWEREAQVKRIIADILVDGFDEARLKSEDDPDFLSTLEAHQWLKRFGNILSIKDLIPKNETLLKDRLKDKFPDGLPKEIAATSPQALNSGAPITPNGVPAPPSLVDLLKSA